MHIGWPCTFVYFFALIYERFCYLSLFWHFGSPHSPFWFHVCVCVCVAAVCSMSKGMLTSGKGKAPWIKEWVLILSFAYWLWPLCNVPGCRCIPRLLRFQDLQARKGVCVHACVTMVRGRIAVSSGVAIWNKNVGMCILPYSKAV